MQEISILIAPDKSEMVIPILNKEMDCVHLFVGVESAKLYDMAVLRHDQEVPLVRKRLEKISNLGKIISWFALTDQQHARLTDVTVDWMIGSAERLRALGYGPEAIVSLQDVNDAVADDLTGG